jgi:bifunctional non-homologous end joining protein LigD
LLSRVVRHVLVGPDWVHEIKHDGYRLMVRRQGARVRLFSRRGFDWSHRFPGALKVTSASLDSEAVICGEDGISDFACHSTSTILSMKLCLVHSVRLGSRRPLQD